MLRFLPPPPYSLSSKADFTYAQISIFHKSSSSESVKYSKMQPKITIITVTFNSEQYLEDTITSVINQTYPFIEYIIVDGQSTDGTLELIKKYEPRITQWISEPDKGIADAMNKGIAMASGEFILFLHSDDYLLETNSIETAVNFMDENNDIFAFSIFFQIKSSLHKQKSVWNPLFNFKTKLFHQGVFCRRDLFDNIGLFDIQLQIAMDYDFFLRAYRKNCHVKLINEYIVTIMRDTGISSKKDWLSLEKRFSEEKKVHFKNCNSIIGKGFYHLYWLLYLPYQRLKYAWSVNFK